MYYITHLIHYSSVIAPIEPARYRLSGRVEHESLPSGVEVKVRFTSASPKSSASAGGKVIISEKGTFSIYLPAGKYAVSVELGAEQKGKQFLCTFHTKLVSDNSLFQDVILK